MRFFWNNLIDASGVTFTPTSEVSTLPVENIANEFRARVWRTGTSVADENVVIDLGSAQSVTSIILLDHTLTSGDSAIAIQGNASDSWGAPSVNESLTYAAGTISKVFTGGAYRYWRLKFTKASSGVSRDIGRVFLGPYLEPTDLPDYDGYDERLEDLSRKTKARSGQTWTDQLPQFATLNVSMSRFGQTDVDNIKTMLDTVGQSKSFFFQCETSGSLNKVWYVKNRRAFSRKVVAYDGGYKWDFNMEMEEQL